MERSLTWQLSAIEASTANSTACRLSTGSGPGNPRHTGHTLVFGGLPNWVEQPQKILVLVRSWTWTSSPMTGSYLDCVATGASGVVTISFDYNGAMPANQSAVVMPFGLQTPMMMPMSTDRSEERRVGKECRSRRS